MIILRHRTLLILALVFGALSLGMGIYGYQLTASESAASAEKILFVGIVVAVVTITTMLAILRSAVSLDKRLDRLIEQGRNRDIVPGRDFSAFGPLGSKLNVLFNQLSETNLKKSRKISAMAALIEFLIRNQSIPVVVTDITGAVRYMSEEFLDRHKLGRAEILDENIEDFVDNLVIPSLVLNVSRLKDAVEGTGTKGEPYVCYPLTDRSGETAYLVFMFGAKASFFDVRSSSQNGSKKTPNTLISGLSRLVNRQ